MASRTAKQWESSPAQIYCHQVLPASPEEIEDGAHQKTDELPRICRDPWRPHAHLSLAEPEVADSFPAGGWRVARDWSPAYSGKATPGPQGVITIKAHTVLQSLCFFAILLKETLDFGLPNTVRFQTCTFINQLKKASICFIRQTFVHHWKTKGCY